jgi:septal ring factor EnvC (AmiA/AmiB activator)
MKAQDSLLREARFRVDDINHRIATLDAMRVALDRELTELTEAVAREKTRANGSITGRPRVPRFLQSIFLRCKNVRTSMKELECERAREQKRLAVAAQDLKTLELAEEERRRYVAEFEARAAHSRAEDRAILTHLRKHKIRRGLRLRHAH